MIKKLQEENDEIFKKDIDLAFSSLLYWFWDNFELICVKKKLHIRHICTSNKYLQKNDVAWRRWIDDRGAKYVRRNLWN